MAGKILGFEHCEEVNLFPIATNSVLEIAELGAFQKSWLPSREEIRLKLQRSVAVVLAYGVSEPTGRARDHHRDQVATLRQEIAAVNIDIWTVGGRPRHPSRWQRHTSRECPGMDFENALRHSLEASTSWPD